MEWLGHLMVTHVCVRNEVNSDLHPAVRPQSPRGGVKCRRAQLSEFSLELTLIFFQINVLFTTRKQM